MSRANFLLCSAAVMPTAVSCPVVATVGGSEICIVATSDVTASQKSGVQPLLSNAGRTRIPILRILEMEAGTCFELRKVRFRFARANAFPALSARKRVRLWTNLTDFSRRMDQENTCDASYILCSRTRGSVDCE